MAWLAAKMNKVEWDVEWMKRRERCLTWKGNGEDKDDWAGEWDRLLGLGNGPADFETGHSGLIGSSKVSLKMRSPGLNFQLSGLTIGLLGFEISWFRTRASRPKVKLWYPLIPLASCTLQRFLFLLPDLLPSSPSNCLWQPSLSSKSRYYIGAVMAKSLTQSNPIHRVSGISDDNW